MIGVGICIGICVGIRISLGVGIGSLLLAASGGIQEDLAGSGST